MTTTRGIEPVAREQCQAHRGDRVASLDPVLLCRECSDVLERRHAFEPVRLEHLYDRQRELGTADHAR